MNTAVSTVAPAASRATRVASIRTSAPVGRLVLRARGDLDALNAALGLSLPNVIGRRTTADAMQALCLGPDEWSLQLPPGY